MKPEPNPNLVQIFLDRVSQYQSRPALFYKDHGRYQPISWLRWREHVEETALGLYALGVRKGDRVAILSENRPEWTYADLGVLSLGAVGVPIYPTSSLPDILHVCRNAGVRAVFLSNLDQLEKMKKVCGEIECLEQVICFHEEEVVCGKKVMRYSDLSQKGREEKRQSPEKYEELVRQVVPADLATIIYTSGTTGPPKGVMLNHDHFIQNVIGSSPLIPVSDQDRALSFLPLCHVFERMAGYYFMMYHGAPIAYAESMQTVAEDILQVKPTVAAAVPRFYEKIFAAIQEKVEQGPPLRKKIFNWALQVGRKSVPYLCAKKPLPALLGLQYCLAQVLVFKKIKEKLGGRIRFFISGGAPLSKELAEFFFTAGVLILEGYGLTETSPVMSVNSPDDFVFGTVGKPLANVEVKIAQDSEILTKGPCVMVGYYQNKEATEEVIRGGWFHTGDIGQLDERGFLHITDRKKDIIVTSGGKNVAPQNIENLILGDKLFVQVVVVGDKRNYLVALVVPNRAEIERLAQASGHAGRPYEELLKEKDICDFIHERIQKRTEGLASYEQVKYFALLPKELTQEAGELTPTLKVKRRVVAEKYKDLIEALYRKGARYASS